MFYLFDSTSGRKVTYDIFESLLKVHGKSDKIKSQIDPLFSTILYKWQMTSFGLQLQKVKKVREADHISKRKLTKRAFLYLACLSNIISFQ